MLTGWWWCRNSWMLNTLIHYFKCWIFTSIKMLSLFFHRSNRCFLESNLLFVHIRWTRGELKLSWPISTYWYNCSLFSSFNFLFFYFFSSSKFQYLDFDNLPETNFTCAGKVIGGYYADLETSCQMFHVCTIGQLDEPMDIKFLCLNGTVFDQETRVCERVDEVDCTKSEKFYYLNLELYGNTMVPIPEGKYRI